MSRRLLPLALTVLALASCSTTRRSDQASGGAADTAAPAAASGLSVRAVDVPQFQAALQAARARVKVVNVWATWCAPCRKEFPDLMRVYRDYQSRGVELVLVSTDMPDQTAEIRAFLADHGVDFPTYLMTGRDMEFIDALSPKWTGAIPATFVYDGGGTLRHFHEGMASYEEFEREIVDVLGSKDSIPKEAGS